MTAAVVFWVIFALIAAGARGTLRNIRAEFNSPAWELEAGQTYCGTCGDPVPTDDVGLHFLVEHTADDQLPKRGAAMKATVSSLTGRRRAVADPSEWDAAYAEFTEASFQRQAAAAVCAELLLVDLPERAREVAEGDYRQATERASAAFDKLLAVPVR